MAWFAIASIIIEIIKLLISLKKKNPVLVKQYSQDLKVAQKENKIEKLQDLLVKIKKASEK